MSSTVLITGVAGFIGSHLAAAVLNQGRRVVGIDNFDPFYDRVLKQRSLQALARRDFELHEMDIRDSVSLLGLLRQERPAIVVHLAALAGVRPSIENPAAYASVNVDGTVSLLEAVRAAGAPPVVFASSSSVYGNNAKVPFSENDPADDPISPYAATKRAGELICSAYAAAFGLRVAALRFFTVYGPRQRPDLAISKFMRLMAHDREIPMFGNGATSRDYTFIDDIVSGVLAAMELIERCDSSGRPGELPNGGFYRAFNLGSSHPVTLDELLRELAIVIGKPVRTRREAEQTGDVQRTFADLARSGAELNYQPRTPLRDGLHRQWQAMASQAVAAAER